MVMSLVRSDAITTGEEQLAIFQEELATHREDAEYAESYLKDSFRERLYHTHKLAIYRKRLRDAGYDPVTGTSPLPDADTATIQRLVSSINATTLHLNELDEERGARGAEWQRLKYELPSLLKDIKEAEERIETVRSMPELDLMEEARLAREKAEEDERILCAAAEAAARCPDYGWTTCPDLWSSDDEMEVVVVAEEEEEEVKEEDQSTGDTTETSNEAPTEAPVDVSTELAV